MSAKQSLYFDILSLLVQHGIAETVDITSVFNEHFVKPKSPSDAAWSKRQNDIIAYLNKLKSNGHINYVYKPVDEERKPEWIVPFTVTAEVTLSGLDYYYEHKVKIATIKSLTDQLIYNFITWGIALIAIGVTVYTINQNIDLSQRLTRLEQEKQLRLIQPHSTVATHKTGDTTRKSE